jgi:hypothetical protein
MALSYATAIDSVNMDSLPLFSPTLAKSHENVLHSIFSPTNGGANRHYKAPFGDVTNLKTPGGPKPRLPIKASPSIPLASGSDLFFTPASQSPRRRYKVKFQQPSSPGADSFYSPSAFHSSASPLSTISALSYSTTGTSFRSVPIDMLSFGYVTACKSEDELEQIVDSLQADGPRNYPSLLKVAKQRLEVVQKENRHHVTTSLQHDESHLSFSMSHISATSSEPSPLQMKPREDIFRMDLISEDIEEEKRSTAPPIQRSLAWNQTSPTMSNSQGDDSSLIMSLSTAYLKEVDSEILTTTSQSRLNTFFPRNEQLKATTFQASNTGSIRRQIVPVSNQLQEQLRRMRAERTDIEKKLREQVTDLTKNLENVEKARRQDQALLLAKLQEVENKKAQVEEEVTMLEMAVRSSTERAKDVISTMTEMKNETKFLRKVLDDERRCERLNSSKAKEIEASLREQLKKLSTLLVDSESSAKQAKDMTEMTMRNEFEDERAQHKAAAQALNRCLKDARGMLQNMKSERNNILQSLGEALGKNASEVRHQVNFPPSLCRYKLPLSKPLFLNPRLPKSTAKREKNLYMKS